MKRLLLAGSVGPERLASRKDAGDPRWFEALHVRDPSAARSRIADQVAAGADIVVAPTWQTHRRALLPVGETRRAREWTSLAGSLAREAIEEGLERRALVAQEQAEKREGDPQAVPDTGLGGSSLALQPEPILAGVLPLLDEQPEAGSGRLAPANIAADRDYRDQAGLLSDAGVDIVLIEGQRTVSGTRTAIEAVRATGLPAWIAAIPRLIPRDPEAASLQRWIDTSVHAGATALLAPVADSDAAEEAVAVMAPRLAATGLRWGCQVLVSTGDATVNDAAAGDEVVGAWLQSSAELYGVLDGAAAEAVKALREEIDRIEQEEWAIVAAGHRRWRTFVEDAARMAPGGAALWIVERSGLTEEERRLPAGFDWVSTPATDLMQMPRERFRFIVDAAGSADVRHLGSLLEAGGLLASQLHGAAPDTPAVRLLTLDESTAPTLALFRRER